MSRLGRNYLQVGYYLEEFFPDNNIRFIGFNLSYEYYYKPSIPSEVLIKEFPEDDIVKEHLNKINLELKI